MKLESKITCRACKRSIVGLGLYTMFEEHVRGLGWVKEVGYTLDTWVCNNCVKNRTNQEYAYFSGASFPVVTTYCDTCSSEHSCMALTDTDIQTNLGFAGWVQVNDKIYKWRCPVCWRASLADIRKTLEQAMGSNMSEHTMKTVKRLNINEGKTTIFCAKCPAAYSSRNEDDNMSVELFNMGWRNVNVVPHGMNWICFECAKRHSYLVQVIFPTGMSSTTTTGGNVNAPTPKKPEPEMRYPMCLVFKSGKEEIYYVTNKTREQVRMALVSNMAVQFEYFLLTTEEEPSGVFACPHGMIERMQ